MLSSKSNLDFHSKRDDKSAAIQQQNEKIRRLVFSLLPAHMRIRNEEAQRNSNATMAGGAPSPSAVPQRVGKRKQVILDMLEASKRLQMEQQDALLWERLEMEHQRGSEGAISAAQSAAAASEPMSSPPVIISVEGVKAQVAVPTPKGPPLPGEHKHRTMELRRKSLLFQKRCKEIAESLSVEPTPQASLAAADGDITNKEEGVSSSDTTAVSRAEPGSPSQSSSSLGLHATESPSKQGDSKSAKRARTRNAILRAAVFLSNASGLTPRVGINVQEERRIANDILRPKGEGKFVQPITATDAEKVLCGTSLVGASAAPSTMLQVFRSEDAKAEERLTEAEVLLNAVAAQPLSGAENGDSDAEGSIGSGDANALQQSVRFSGMDSHPHHSQSKNSSKKRKQCSPMRGEAIASMDDLERSILSASAPFLKKPPVEGTVRSHISSSVSPHGHNPLLAEGYVECPARIEQGAVNSQSLHQSGNHHHHHHQGKHRSGSLLKAESPNTECLAGQAPVVCSPLALTFEEDRIDDSSWIAEACSMDARVGTSTSSAPRCGGGSESPPAEKKQQRKSVVRTIDLAKDALSQYEKKEQAKGARLVCIPFRNPSSPVHFSNEVPTVVVDELGQQDALRSATSTPTVMLADPADTSYSRPPSAAPGAVHCLGAGLTSPSRRPASSASVASSRLSPQKQNTLVRKSPDAFVSIVDLYGRPVDMEKFITPKEFSLRTCVLDASPQVSVKDRVAMSLNRMTPLPVPQPVEVLRIPLRPSSSASLRPSSAQSVISFPSRPQSGFASPNKNLEKRAAALGGSDVVHRWLAFQTMEPAHRVNCALPTLSRPSSSAATGGKIAPKLATDVGAAAERKKAIQTMFCRKKK